MAQIRYFAIENATIITYIESCYIDCLLSYLLRKKKQELNAFIPKVISKERKIINFQLRYKFAKNKKFNFAFHILEET